MTSEKKYGKAFGGQWVYCMFFSMHYCYGENKKAKAGKRRNDSRSSEEDIEESNSNNSGISFFPDCI